MVAANSAQSKRASGAAQRSESSVKDAASFSMLLAPRARRAIGGAAQAPHAAGCNERV